MVRAALNGDLDDVAMRTDPNFGIAVPEQVPDVPAEVLDPRQTWSDKDAYDEQVKILITKFHQNLTQYADEIDSQIIFAGPLMEKRT